MRTLDCLSHQLLTVASLFQDTPRFLGAVLRSRSALMAENLFLRQQLVLYLERKVKPRRANDATRLTRVLLSRLFAWRQALTLVQPDTLIRWHRKGFRLFWRWKSRPRGRPCLPIHLRDLIGEMAVNNPTWGEERIAAELLLKLGIRVSPRTIRRSMPENTGSGLGVSSQRWMTFVRERAHQGYRTQGRTPYQTFLDRVKETMTEKAA